GKIRATASRTRMSDRARVFIVASLAALLLGACASRSPPPVVERSPPPSGPAASPPPPSAPQRPARTTDWRPQTYTVKAGATLAKIALDHGLDYRELASWNGIDNPNIIRVGQVLVLAAPGQAPAPNAGGAVTAPLVTTAPVASAGTEPKSTATAPAPGS